MIYAAAPMPSLVEQLQDYMRTTNCCGNEGTRKVMERAAHTAKRILECIEDHGPQTELEIASRLGIPSRTVYNHLRLHVQAGMIRPLRERPRRWGLRG